MRSDHSGLQYESHAKTVYAHVVADAVQSFDAFSNESRDEVFRNTAESESAEHDSRAIRNIGDCFISVGIDLVHDAIIARNLRDIGGDGRRQKAIVHTTGI